MKYMFYDRRFVFIEKLDYSNKNIIKIEVKETDI